jgi:hypothetical protein
MSIDAWLLVLLSSCTVISLRRISLRNTRAISNPCRDFHFIPRLCRVLGKYRNLDGAGCLIPLSVSGVELGYRSRTTASMAPPDWSHAGSAGLANESYRKLIRAGAICCASRIQIFALCSQLMRRVLVDYVRGRDNAKYGGNAARVPLNDAILGAPACGIGLLALDEALNSLSRIDARKSRVVGCVTSVDLVSRRRRSSWKSP